MQERHPPPESYEQQVTGLCHRLLCMMSCLEKFPITCCSNTKCIVSLTTYPLLPEKAQRRQGDKRDRERF
jgi:hypothetical protein